MRERSHPKVAQMLHNACGDLLAFCGFPPKHWRQIWSTNPIERLNKKIKRRPDVLGVFPKSAVMLRLAGDVLVERHDDWEASTRRNLSEGSMRQLDAFNDALATVDVRILTGVIPVPELSAA
jgi:transposase-like protein